MWEEAVYSVEEFLERYPEQPRTVSFKYREGVRGEYKGVLLIKLRAGSKVFGVIMPASFEQQDMIRAMVFDLVHDAA